VGTRLGRPSPALLQGARARLKTDGLSWARQPGASGHAGARVRGGAAAKGGAPAVGVGLVREAVGRPVGPAAKVPRLHAARQRLRQLLGQPGAAADAQPRDHLPRAQDQGQGQGSVPPRARSRATACCMCRPSRAGGVRGAARRPAAAHGTRRQAGGGVSGHGVALARVSTAHDSAPRPSLTTTHITSMPQCH